jgi:hypothetical protein
MKILLIQENGHHDANRIYRECFSWQRALREYNEIDVTIWGQRHANFYEIPDFNSFDVIICLEQYDRTNWVPHTEISKSKAKKLIWAVDSHSKGIEFFRHLKKIGKYDHILCSILHHTGAGDVYFPNAYDDMLIKPMSVDKRSFLGFCGSGGGPQREQLIRDIKASQKEDFIFDEFVIGDKMVESINSYGLHFNFNVMDDINYRSFETLGCKIPLITNYNYQYDKLGFKDNINCIFYRNRDELIEKINYYKDNKLLLESISEKGYNLSTNHTYRNRIKHLKDKIL